MNPKCIRLQTESMTYKVASLLKIVSIAYNLSDFCYEMNGISLKCLITSYFCHYINDIVDNNFSICCTEC